MSVKDIFSLIKDVFLSAAACTTGYAAVVGVGTWRQELRGRANFEVARQLARAVYVVRDQVRSCRSPFTAQHEFPDTYQPAVKHTSKEEGDAWSHVYSNRWSAVVKSMQDFDAAALEAEALWGGEVKDPCNKLRSCVNELRVDIEMFIHDKYQDGHSINNSELTKKIHSGIWDFGNNENDLTNRINDAIQGIEAFLRPHLSRGKN